MESLEVGQEETVEATKEADSAIAGPVISSASSSGPINGKKSKSSKDAKTEPLTRTVWVTQGRTEHLATLFVGQTRKGPPDTNSPKEEEQVLIKWNSTMTLDYVPVNSVRSMDNGEVRRRKSVQPIYIVPEPSNNSKSNNDKSNSKVTRKRVRRRKSDDVHSKFTTEIKESMKQKPHKQNTTRKRRRSSPRLSKEPVVDATSTDDDEGEREGVDEEEQQPKASREEVLDRKLTKDTYFKNSNKHWNENATIPQLESEQSDIGLDENQVDENINVTGRSSKKLKDFMKETTSNNETKKRGSHLHHPDLCIEKYNLSERDDFPLEVFSVLNDASRLEIDHIISWLSDGISFRIHNEALFLRLLIKVSTNRNVNSFQRTLRRFGFKCIESNQGGKTYVHESAMKAQSKSAETCKDADGVKEAYTLNESYNHLLHNSLLFHRGASSEQLKQIQRKQSVHTRHSSSLIIPSSTNTSSNVRSKDSPYEKSAESNDALHFSDNSLSSEIAFPRKRRRPTNSSGLNGSASLLSPSQYKNQTKRRKPSQEKSFFKQTFAHSDNEDCISSDQYSSSDDEDDSPLLTNSSKYGKHNAFTFQLARKESDERRSRRTNDGYLLPKKTPKRNRDGTYAMPSGRRPPKLSWDPIRGLWAPRCSKKESVKAAESVSKSETSSVTLQQQSNDGTVQQQSMKSVSKLVNSVTSSRLSKEPAERLARRTIDGCLYPKTPAIQLEDGTYARPGGAQPKNLVWDPVRGVFAPIKHTKKVQEPPTERNEYERQPPHRLMTQDLSNNLELYDYSESSEPKNFVVRVRSNSSIAYTRASRGYSFKGRRQFTYKARTKGNPTGIIGGDNEYSEHINKSNWDKIRKLMLRTQIEQSSSSSQHDDDYASLSTSISSTGESTHLAPAFTE